MTIYDPDLMKAVLRQDLTSFIRKTFKTVSPGDVYKHNWHIEAIAHQLTRCLDGEIRRLIIAIPPRNLKSICASVAFPAFALGQDPRRKIVCVSFADDLTVKHARDCRAVMESAWYRQVFPGTRLAGRAEGELVTTAGGSRFATTVGGTLTGRGGGLIIIDDPMKGQDAESESRREVVKQWYSNTLLSRRDDKAAGAIVLIMQRLHVDDLVGHVTRHEDWEVLTLPAIAEEEQTIALGGDRYHYRDLDEVLHPAREPRAELDRLKREMGTYAFSAQYQQAPVPLGGAMIQWRWFKVYRDLPWRGAGDRIVQSWDTASKTGAHNDYSVGTTWLIKGSDYFLLDVVRERLVYPELKRRVQAEALRHGPATVIVEDKDIGKALIQDLRTGPVRAIAFEPEGDKIVRMSAQSAKIEAGQVHLPERAPWLDDFKAEIMQFPYGRHDDQVDSLSQFLAWIDWRKRMTVRVGKF